METLETTTTSELLKSDNTKDTSVEKELKDEKNVPEKQAAEAVDTAKNLSENEQEIHKNVPKKFLDKSGNIRVGELAKSYLELEPLINEKAQWAKEKETLLNKLNEHPKALQPDVSQKALAYIQAGLYSKMIDEAKDPKQVEELLKEFKTNPAEELIEKIEDNFSKKVVKSVTMQSQKNLQQTNQQILKRNLEQLKTHLEDFKNQALEKYKTHFYNPAFRKLFNKAFELTGTNLDVPALVSMLDEYAKSKVLEFQLQKKRQQENANATTELAGMVPSSETKKQEELPDVNLLEIQDKELLKKYIQKYNKK